MWCSVITLFPEYFDPLIRFGVTGRAIKQGLINLELVNLKDFCQGDFAQIDDRPYGGGPGMVLRIEPLQRAIQFVKEKYAQLNLLAKVVYLSPEGQVLTQAAVKKCLHTEALILICGRYEGIDERVLKTWVDEEWSIGDYILTGGELAAMVFIDAMTRLKPGTLHTHQSVVKESHTDGLLDCPHYTRPRQFKGMDVPKVLLSGNHMAIDSWRLKQQLGRTWQKRPDMLASKILSIKEQVLLNEYMIEVSEEKKT